MMPRSKNCLRIRKHSNLSSKWSILRNNGKKILKMSKERLLLRRWQAQPRIGLVLMKKSSSRKKILIKPMLLLMNEDWKSLLFKINIENKCFYNKFKIWGKIKRQYNWIKVLSMSLLWKHLIRWLVRITLLSQERIWLIIVKLRTA